MVTLPLIKLITLAMKQVSKPVANQLKHAAKTSPFFRKYVCAPPAQALHHLEMFVKYRLMGGTGRVEYAPLKEERAVEVGSEMIGEMVVYSIAAGILFYELWSSKQQSEERDRAQDMRIASVKELILQQEKELFLLRSRVEKMEEEQRQNKGKKPSSRTARS